MTLRMLGIGDGAADYYMHTNTIYPGGCAYNFAVYAKMLGADSAFLGIVGDDFAGRHVMNTAGEIGVDTSRCRVLYGKTAMPAVRIENGERVFVHCDNQSVRDRPLILSKKDLFYISGFDLVHTSLYSRMEQNLETLAETGVPLSMDFGTAQNDLFLAANCPSVTYAVLSCRHLSEADTVRQMEKTHRFGARYVLATRGAQGAWFFDGDEIYHRPVRQADVRDTLGAGDAFLTAFLMHYVSHTMSADTGRETRAAAATAALDEAAGFSAGICGLDGSFGHGTVYHEG